MKWKMPSCPPHPALTREKYTLRCDGVKRKIKWRRL
jgi:hypothetical protein